MAAPIVTVLVVIPSFFAFGVVLHRGFARSEIRI
jgi:hypothetical protein